MTPNSTVELADKFSRKRAWLVGAAAVAFAANVAGQIWLQRTGNVSTTRLDWWLIHAVVMLLIVATGGGLLIQPRVRALMNDEVAKSHFATGIVSGFWVAMLAAMTMYVLPTFRDLSVQTVVRVVVSTSVSVALLVFAWLEIRAHRDA